MSALDNPSLLNAPLTPTRVAIVNPGQREKGKGENNANFILQNIHLLRAAAVRPGVARIRGQGGSVRARRLSREPNRPASVY